MLPISLKKGRRTKDQPTVWPRATIVGGVAGGLALFPLESRFTPEGGDFMQQPQALQRSTQKPKKDLLLKHRLFKASTRQAADFLCFLAEGLRKGSFTLRAGEQSALLTASSLLELSVRLQRKPKNRARVKEQLKLELAWKERDHALLPSIETDDCCRDVLAALERAPFGLSLQELGHALSMPWGRLTWPVRNLMAAGRVVRVKKLYRLV